MEIPYTVEPRPDSGLANGKLGIWLFLASEVMLFGALFSTYILLRVGALEWPHGELNVWLGAINTVILICSSVTMVVAWAQLKLNNFANVQSFVSTVTGLPFASTDPAGAGCTAHRCTLPKRLRPEKPLAC